jgi:hypothetical protein
LFECILKEDSTHPKPINTWNRKQNDGGVSLQVHGVAWKRREDERMLEMSLASYTLQTMACWSESSRGRKINLLLWESSDSSCEEVHEWDTSKRRMGAFEVSCVLPEWGSWE